MLYIQSENESVFFCSNITLFSYLFNFIFKFKVNVFNLIGKINVILYTCVSPRTPEDLRRACIPISSMEHYPHHRLQTLN